MTKGDKIKITFNGKEIDVTVVAEGVVQKTASIFYIRDSVSGEWLYCFPARLERLMKKFEGDLTGFKGRATKKAEKDALKAQKKIEKEANKKAREEAATKAAEKVVAAGSPASC